MTNVDGVGFERLARPLLELIQRITGLETSFVTQIDWASQQQQVVLALNTSDLEVPEGAVVDWSDSMCRWAFLSHKEQSSDVAKDFPGSLGADQLGMLTFFAVPILADDATLGTVCGASRRSVELEADVMLLMRLVAETMSFQMAAQRESQVHRERAERAETLAFTDPLTELANRRAFTARLEEELARSGRHGSPIAVLVIDVDCFKAVNDTFGHHGGDTVLNALGEVLRQVVRAADVPARLEHDDLALLLPHSQAGDIPARLGGDEFALLLPAADAAGAETVAARIAEGFRLATARLGMPCTLSIGISTSETTPRRSLLAAADDALYRSKANGRDRAEISAACA